MDAWEFWIDVGGTFTDCLGRSPLGRVVRHKTLSSGIVKGCAQIDAPTLAMNSLRDPARCHDPADFWQGWMLRVTTAQGDVAAERMVAQFDAARGSFLLEAPLPADMPIDGPVRYELRSSLEAPLVAMRYLTGCGLNVPLPPCRVRLGTTRGTNALLTRSGARVAWITTRGFADLLEIGYQSRPELFALHIQKPQPLYERVVEVDERLTAQGTVLRELDEHQVREALRSLRDTGIDTIAVGLLHAYKNPIHEQRVEQIAGEFGFREISISSRVSPLMKLVTRGDTTVVNAYLNPVLGHYLERLEAHLPDASPSKLRLMTSTGGLVAAEHFQGRDSILSGPAGGVVGFAGVARAAGFDRAIGFDMGGTSTDVARFHGRFDYDQETEKAGVRLSTPMLAIETVAAGGGSLCRFDGVKLVVGPESAGADPGPACYGRGGPLTVTDMNLMLGRIPADAFPFPLDRETVIEKLAFTSERILAVTGNRYTPIELAEGFLRIANTNMAQAIRSISIGKGSDPREDILVAFGGAAPQHACSVATELQMTRVLIHPDASILSALGIGLADVARHAERGIYQPLRTCCAFLVRTASELEQDTVDAVQQEGIDPARIQTQRFLDLRYAGTDWSLSIPWNHANAEDAAWIEQAFAQQHQHLYGYLQPNRELEVATMRVTATGSCGWSLPVSGRVSGPVIHSSTTRPMTIDGHSRSANVFQRRDLRPGERFTGPALVLQDNSTTVVDLGWTAEVLEQGELLLERISPAADPPTSTTTERDPITLEIFHRHFESIASQMGIVLRNTSTSVNVKERLDFSCAIFTATGDLVVNAPHIPVHLGAMSQTVKQTLRDQTDLGPGDVIVTNDPFNGGSHLPDVTVITPVFAAVGGELRFVVASRAHHAEIGGLTPGSMPPFSRALVEEGVLIRSFKLLDRGVSRIEELRRMLLDAPYPTRDAETNLADLRAQVAANQQGVRDLQSLETRYGWPVVAAYMQHIQAAAEDKMRSALRKLGNRTFHFEDHLDEGAAIRVRIEVVDGEASIDFSGSAPVQPNNLNANTAIVTAAVMYVMRCLMDEPIPLNQGVLAPIRLEIPPGMIHPSPAATPEQSPAVAGGNVETSQRIVDCLLGALELAGASQGTMNNLLFGNGQFGYYETICGGAGATAKGPGASAVHTHMTNTRLTDPEVLEAKYPIRLHQFSIRRGSGGAGRMAGGDGVIRRIEFLVPLELSLLTQRRGPYPPYGMHGAHPGALGVNELQRHDGTCETLANRAQTRVQPGDVLTIMTPGGGGWGTPAD